MARYLLMLLIGAGLCFLFSGTLSRPATADPSTDVAKKESPSEPTRIALVDMARLFKTSKAFERNRDELKAKISDAEDVAKKTLAEIQQMTQRSMSLEQGSEERRDLEVRLKRKQAEFEEFRKNTSRRFLKEESEIYVKIYRVAAKEIAAYAQSHRIDLVIRHNSEPLNDEDPQKLLQSLNREVVYENKLDITDEIIAAMSEQ